MKTMIEMELLVEICGGSWLYMQCVKVCSDVSVHQNIDGYVTVHVIVV